MMGKAKTQQRLIDNLENEFGKVSLFLSLNFFLVMSLLCMQIYDYGLCKIGPEGVPSSRG